MEETKIDLFRSVRIEQYPQGAIIATQPAPEILYPDFEPQQLPNGKTRKRDIESFADGKGDMWVEAGGGTSLFDRAKVFQGKSWLSFEIPQGTVIPESLVVRFTGYNKIFDANHYQIESRAKTMRMDAFKGALDNLARNAIVRAVELGKKI
jgi:Tse2 ADP-ribosyltransferase toxins